MQSLKQAENSPMSVAEITAVLHALNNGDLDDVEVSRITAFEKAYMAHLKSSHADLIGELNEKTALSDQIVESLNNAMAEFKATGTY